MSDPESILDEFIGREVVLDLTSPYVILGTYRGCDRLHYIIEDADVHDLRDTTTTRELYVLDAKRHGVNCNRKRALVRQGEVVSISLLADVSE
jgi:hypothetical protein